jgi:2',3'-cyclic-nucleotide 2'-phosphodiesterase/3'-nucleotidase
MNYLSFIIASSVISILLSVSSCNRSATEKVIILGTTDIHGAILPYDYIQKHETSASLANAATYIRKLRKDEEAGNHDIEAGHSVYDRLADECNFPVLAANAVDIRSGNPYFTPFAIIKKNNFRIAVMGLITPAVPDWIPEDLYSGIEFRDMVETAKKWMPEILKQNPDLIVGLFHAGWNSEYIDYKETDHLNENGSAAVAYNVPGFDIIFTGHDHRVANEKFLNCKGDTVLILNAGSHCENIAQADVTLSSKKISGRRKKRLSGKIIDVSTFNPDKEFTERFDREDALIKKYVNKVIGTSTSTFSTRDSYFGSSAFVDMLHSAQLEITGADISFAAPLSFDVRIDKGPVTVSDMFKLYRFENFLYTIKMTGEEVRKYLEFSYSGWLNTMKGPEDYLLKYRLGKDGKPLMTNGRAWLRNPSYDFDSAAGIDYFVDVSKPQGERVIIKSFSNGSPFENNKMYKIAVNSHRGNGGGRHLTEGAGIKKDELQSRLIHSTKKDLRYYIMKSTEEKKVIQAHPMNNWKIIPEDWVKNAALREYKLLFGVSAGANE